MWFLDQQHHLGTYEKCTFSSPFPDLLNQELGVEQSYLCLFAVKGRNKIARGATFRKGLFFPLLKMSDTATCFYDDRRKWGNGNVEQ